MHLIHSIVVSKLREIKVKAGVLNFRTNKGINGYVVIKIQYDKR